LVVLAAAAPFLVHAASHSSYDQALQIRDQQLQTRHEVPAVLTVDAAQSAGFSLTTGVLTAATWTSAAGVQRAGEVPASPGAVKGQHIRVWTDDSTGYLDGPPLTMSEAAGQADAAMIGAVVGIGVAYAAGAGVIMYVLNRRRMAAWEADWLTTGPAWNRQQRW